MAGKYGIKEKTGAVNAQVRSEKRKGIWMGFAAGMAAALLAGMGEPAKWVSAQEPVREMSGVTVRDEDMRKLLIREGAVCEADGPLFIEIPWELIQGGENLYVEVCARKTAQKEKYRLVFSCREKLKGKD